MNLLRRHFKTVTILLITLIICLSVLLILDGINDKVNGREAQGFSSSLKNLRPVDVPGMINHVASRINGDLVHPNDITLNESDDDDDDNFKSDADDWVNEEEDDDDDDWLDEEDGNDGNVKNTAQINRLEQLNLDPSLVKIKEKMIARQDHLHKECARLGMRRLNLDDPKDLHDVIAHKGNLDTLFWNDKFKFITSVMFKSGSGNWKKFLMELAAKQGTINFPPQLQKAHYKADKPISILVRKSLEVKYRLKNYLKIVTVRHPLIRFLSGYRDKFFEHTDKFRKDVPNMIIDLRKGNARASGPKHVTFPEFADYVLRMQSTDRDTNDPHWARQYVRSRPCQHDYDIIAKLETSDDDMDFIKRVVGIDGKVLFRKEYTERHEVSNNNTLAVRYYQQLSEEALQRVCDYYRIDFDLFGYYRPENVSDVARIFDDFF